MEHDPNPFTRQDIPVPHSIATTWQLHNRGSYRRGGKRAADLILIALATPFLLPLIALLAVLVMRDGATPFFGHKRIGKDGREFRCWKIRSMSPDAEEKLKAFLSANPAARAEWEHSFKLEHDPRITRIGRVLRKTSFDELPQIWNILRGEMSFVGPRPVTAKELTFYGVSVAEYQAMSPGLTGLWQISGRNALSYSERVALDVSYHRDCSFMLDCGILLRTAGAVLKQTGR